MMQNEIHQVELEKSHAQEMIDRKKMLASMETTRPFKKLVLEGYFEKEAARLALLLSDPQLTDAQRNQVHQDICGIGAFQRYLRTIVQFGIMAENAMADIDAVLEDMRDEETAE